MRTRARKYHSLSPPPLVKPAALPKHAAAHGTRQRQPRTLMVSAASAIIVAFAHAATIRLYGQTCGIDLLQPSTWLYGMSTVNSTWCLALSWTISATSASTNTVATSACMLLAVKYLRRT